MTQIQMQNNQPFDLDSIIYLKPDAFQEAVLDELAEGSRMIAFTPVNRNNPRHIACVLFNPNISSVVLIGADVSGGDFQYDSFANAYPHTNYFECELAELYGCIPANHPWLRPVRKQNFTTGNVPYKFFKLGGEEVHEVAVGPIHAGVIEPGHFRFQCHGELVYNLEISLGYQHRGVEELMVKSNPVQRIILAESIAGDTAIGHTLAHCNAVEALTQSRLGLRAEVIRMIAAEIERVAMHLAGLGGVANDIGFALPASSYGRLRTLAINSLALLCGSRFGRGLFVYGGTRFDATPEIVQKIVGNLLEVQHDVRKINEYFFSSVGTSSRLEETGTVNSTLAKSIGMVGLAARASGLEEDVRVLFPYGAYRYNPVPILTLASGDVFARTRLRAMEIDESLRLILEQLENLPDWEIYAGSGAYPENTGVISIVEGWRGEIVHMACTGANGELIQYKIKDPSFNNWYGLSMALRETAISDFPLCNKSFDLSYSG
ncbi:MAG: NADH-quinone oxidoreductase subunit C, partial [Ignavibacteriales bacterium]|nr:NADH-quinone oxidoreductase subunit C [Ignavibacteriales bacterium]